MENISVDNASFDVAVSFETLEHITDHDKMVAEIKRVIKPGGVLLISTPDKLIYREKQVIIILFIRRNCTKLNLNYSFAGISKITN
ncbi:MAG: class I SAM-dependent methyltransferase [Chitinophagaceae bacterium]|nr:class I SAM-dependent methyltransferase [Chitinophagaceae bacterium]